MSQQNTRPEALATSLAALPGAVVRPTEHAAKGYDLDSSVERAKEYISGCLSAMLDLGRGSGPMNHMHKLFLD